MSLVEKAKRKYTQDGFVSLVESSPGYLFRTLKQSGMKFFLNEREYIAVASGMDTILKYYNPQSFVEIGVGKGDSLKTYLSVCEPENGDSLKYYGFDTFCGGLPDENEEDHVKYDVYDPNEVKQLNTSMDEIKNIPNEFETPCDVKLFKGNTQTTIEENKEHLTNIDLVYIDGGHSYETVKSDYKNIRSSINQNATIIFDDFNGQDGVTKFIGELLQHEGRRFDDTTDDKFDNIIISPASFSGNQTVHIIIEI